MAGGVMRRPVLVGNLPGCVAVGPSLLCVGQGLLLRCQVGDGRYEAAQDLIINRLCPALSEFPVFFALFEYAPGVDSVSFGIQACFPTNR